MTVVTVVDKIDIWFTLVLNTKNWLVANWRDLQTCHGNNHKIMNFYESSWLHIASYCRLGKYRYLFIWSS